MTFLATDFKIYLSGNKYYAKEKFSTIIKRYYKAFGKVDLCCRVDNELNENKLIDISECINSIVVVESLKSLFLGKYNKIIEDYVKNSDFIIVRCPSFIAFKTAKYAYKHSKKYLAEVMGCVWDALWNHGIKGKLIAPIMYLKMKRILRNANYAIYVTETFLQKRYPCNCPNIAASNVEINTGEEKILNNRLKKINKELKTNIVKIMTSAAIDVKYKGQEYVIRAIKKLEKKNITIYYYLAGGGDQKRLKKIAKKNSVEKNVIFLGELKKEKVIYNLDEIDLYIQPSLQEGLPRSVIEAMSRGCPVIGSKTAGIPELIQETLQVKRKSVNDIVKKIEYYSHMSKDEKEKISTENFNKAKEYDKTILENKRNKFFEYIKNN